MVHGKTMKNSVSGRYLKEHEVILKDGIVEILAIECVIFFFFFVFTPRYRN
jgi:hypothetical protein